MLRCWHALGRPRFRRPRCRLLTFELWGSVFAMQHRGEVALQRLSDRTHLQRIRQLVAGDSESPAKGGHLFGGWSHADRRGGHVELDRRAVGSVCAHLDFGDAAGVCEHQFNVTGSRYAKVSRLSMQRLSVRRGSGLLSVDQKWLAHMGNRDFLEIVEGLDRRVFPGPTTLPY